ncbi:MAG: helix-turn-helix transcriptional regulator [Leptolyngbyaceae cyanobacterium]
MQSPVTTRPLPVDTISAEPLDDCIIETASRTDDLDLIFETLLGQFFPFRGFILLDTAGNILRSTTKANEFCALLHRDSPGHLFGAVDSQAGLPTQITALANFLMESVEDFPEHTLQLYDTVFIPGGIRLHLMVKWIELVDQPQQCMLVTLEDLTQIAHHRAQSDSYRYGLTTRETEVWELYLQGFSYREVSEKLMIAHNTVKKHMKGIFSKCNIECRCRHLV